MNGKLLENVRDPNWLLSDLREQQLLDLKCYTEALYNTNLITAETFNDIMQAINQQLANIE